nr:hypothetical protein [Corynebacterium poyangense]
MTPQGLFCGLVLKAKKASRFEASEVSAFAKPQCFIEFPLFVLPVGNQDMLPAVHKGLKNSVHEFSPYSLALGSGANQDILQITNGVAIPNNTG